MVVWCFLGDGVQVRPRLLRGGAAPQMLAVLPFCPPQCTLHVGLPPLAPEKAPGLPSSCSGYSPSCGAMRTAKSPAALRQATVSLNQLAKPLHLQKSSGKAGKGIPSFGRAAAKRLRPSHKRDSGTDISSRAWQELQQWFPWLICSAVGLGTCFKRFFRVLHLPIQRS